MRITLAPQANKDEEDAEEVGLAENGDNWSVMNYTWDEDPEDEENLHPDGHHVGQKETAITWSDSGEYMIFKVSQFPSFYLIAEFCPQPDSHLLLINGF